MDEVTVSQSRPAYPGEAAVGEGRHAQSTSTRSARGLAFSAFGASAVCLALAATKWFEPGLIAQILNQWAVPTVVWVFLWLPIGALAVGGSAVALALRWRQSHQVDSWALSALLLVYIGLAVVSRPAALFVAGFILLPLAATAWVVSTVSRRKQDAGRKVLLARHK